MVTHEEAERMACKLDKLTPSLEYCSKGYWLRHRMAHLTHSLLIGHRIDIDFCELDDKTDEEIKKLISGRIRTVLKGTLKELGE